MTIEGTPTFSYWNGGAGGTSQGGCFGHAGVGGGGAGARVLPSISCLDNKTYEDQGYAKIGTGKYIDCP